MVGSSTPTHLVRVECHICLQPYSPFSISKRQELKRNLNLFQETLKNDRFFPPLLFILKLQPLDKRCFENSRNCLLPMNITNMLQICFWQIYVVIHFLSYLKYNFFKGILLMKLEAEFLDYHFRTAYSFSFTTAF